MLTALIAAAVLSGSVAIDGSSTVYPISESIAEEFQKSARAVRVTAGASGTGAGYKKFCAGETDISDGSRPIKAEEAARCQAAGIEFMELPVAYDGLSIVVNPKNTFVKSLSFGQLRRIWEPGSKVKTWKDLDATWPAEAIKLYGPTSDHGTFDYFTEEVVGKAKSSRADYNAASDTNTLVTGVAGDANALGYFGFAYYAASKSKLRLVPVTKDERSPPVTAEAKTIEDGSYPLARLLFITVSVKSAKRPEVDAFVNRYLKDAAETARSVGYTALPPPLTEQVAKRYERRQSGPWSAVSSH